MTIARSIRLLLALAAVLVVVWSFVEVGARIYREHDPRDRRTVLTVLHWGDSAEAKIVQDLCDRYMREHPDIKIIRIGTSPGNDYASKLKTMLAAGTPPDAFYLPPELLPEMASLKLVRPVDDFIAQEKQAGKAAWLDDYYPILI